MTRWIGEVGLLLLGLSGCGTTSKSNEVGDRRGVDSDDGGTVASDAHPNAGPSPGLKLSWAVGDYSALTPDEKNPGPPYAPRVAGVKVCVRDHDSIPCTMSDRDGMFVLEGLPAATDLILTFEKDGYLKEAQDFETTDTDMTPIGAPLFMFPIDRPEYALPNGVSQDASKGSMNFFALGPAPADSVVPFLFTSGVAVSLEPIQGDGPFFADLAGEFDNSMTTTRGDLGFYYNLAPGQYTLTFSDPNLDCARVSGVSAVQPASVKLTILPGYLTEQMGVLCTPKTTIVGADATTNGAERP